MYFTMADARRENPPTGNWIKVKDISIRYIAHDMYNIHTIQLHLLYVGMLRCSIYDQKLSPLSSYRRPILPVEAE